MELLQGHFWNAVSRGRNNYLLYSSWALVSEKLNAEEKYILLYILEVSKMSLKPDF